ncbi:MAG TPA: A/G-specific adenine glycosylase [Chthoniobacterales bacterium]|nr:A/G-specific adenine glycosylase [Chthoniobacterales bacterium]
MKRSACRNSSAAAFRRALLAWYGKHGRDLPWRHTRDPYAILVSEMMLQQTQVATVVPYYRRWLERFPDFTSLARASESEVLHAWQGLGYYARARNLHAAAKAIVAKHGGEFPDSVERMRELPGLGRYTANAVATFAFDQAVPVVEANIGRLLARITNLRLPIDSAAGQEELWRIAGTLVPRQNAGRFNSALMDLGATVCTARAPRCRECVVRRFCTADDPERLPLKKPRAAQLRLAEHHALVLRDRRILLEQATNRWRGMWILPRVPNESKDAPIYTAVFPFTHHRITLIVHRRTQFSASDGAQWFPVFALASLPIPSPHRRALTHLLDSSPST